ncbi:MAG TPA: DNA polymerase III subunit alpha [Actinomycetes bacterium]|nr:DNA polymerase III subunit alpha [Actinomycetes bacterium]
MSFPHLHVASGWSLRHGASSPEQLVEVAAERGLTLLGLTDRDGVRGAVRFARAALSAGIATVFGVDLALDGSLGSLTAADPKGRSRTPVRGGRAVDPRAPRVTVLARGERGWGALCRLVSAAHARGEILAGRGNPVIDLPLLAEHAADGALVVLLGPDSDLGRLLARQRLDLATATWRMWREQIPELWCEVVNHRGADPAGRSAAFAGRMLRWAHEQQAPVLLTNAVRYARREDAPVADVLDAARRLVPLDVRHIDRRTGEGYLKSSAQMAEVAAEVARLSGIGTERATSRWLLASTAHLAEQCVLDPIADLGLGSVHFPELEVVDPAAVASGTPSDIVLRRRCEGAWASRGLPSGGAAAREARERLEDELAVIAQLGYATYFLTVADVVDLIRSMQVRVAARGSGAGSLVTYLLGISGVDPLRHDLLFERFLSPLRRALPDIDIDVESARRTDIYTQIFERYGADRVACVSMADTYRVRHAIRDVGAALGLPPSEIDTLAKAFPHIRARDAQNALRELPELRASRIADDPRTSLLFSLVERLDGLPRHLALHPCGVLLSDITLLDRTPVESSAMGFAMSQFDKDDVEHLGLLKLDVLGIRMQSAMAYALDEIERVEGVEQRPDLDALPLDDPATFDLVRSTHTLGCFQIESPGQRELIGKFAPETFDDLITDISLFRPGPVKSDMVGPFLRARHGWVEPQYLHPDLEPVLKSTFGVVVFHEQVIDMLHVITGCTRAEGDEKRRALGDPDGQAETREWFYRRASERGYDLPTIERMWEVLRAFGSFGFCKAHAAAFALPTYQSAWLKAHHPASFLAGVLTHDPGMYPKRLILDDARQFGITVLPVDVNASQVGYRVERVQALDTEGALPPHRVAPRVDPAFIRNRGVLDQPQLPDARGYGIRIALSEVKGISEAEVDRIVAGQPYQSLTDFWHRAAVSRPVVERLVLAGAFDALHDIDVSLPVASARRRITRRDLLLQVAELDRWTAMPASRRSRSVAPGSIDTQLSFPLGPSDEQIVPSGLPEMTGAEQVRAELDVLGLDASRHVIEFYGSLLQAMGAVRSQDLLTCRSRSEIVVAGVKVATQTPPIRSGRRVVFVTLDDSTGPVDATFFEDAQGPYAATLFHSWLLVIRGEVRRTGPRGVSLRATGCWELSSLYDLWQQEGMDAVRDHMDTPPPGFGAEEVAAPAAVAQDDQPSGYTAGGMGRRRILVHPSGFKQSPYADVKPAGGDVNRGAPPRKLWHASPGSSGR